MTWVVFDYGNVISYPQPQEAVARLARAAGAPVPAFSASYWQDRLAYDLAELDDAGYWGRVTARLGRPAPAAGVAELTRLDVASWLHLNPGTVELIEDVAARGHRLALLSNAPVAVADAVVTLPVAARFEHCLFSCFLGSAKPAAACYRAVLGRLGAPPADVIFLDDRPENVAGAAAAGIRAVLFTAPGAARASLARLGVAAGSARAPAAGPDRSF